MFLELKQILFKFSEFTRITRNKGYSCFSFWKFSEIILYTLWEFMFSMKTTDMQLKNIVIKNHKKTQDNLKKKEKKNLLKSKCKLKIIPVVSWCLSIFKCTYSIRNIFYVKIKTWSYLLIQSNWNKCILNMKKNFWIWWKIQNMCQ